MLFHVDVLPARIRRPSALGPSRYFSPTFAGLLFNRRSIR